MPPSSVYKGGRRRGPAKGEARPRGGNPTPSRFAPSLSYSKKEKGEGGGGEKEGEGGRRPFPLSNSDWGKGGRAPPPGCPLSSPLRPNRPITSRGGVPVTPGTPVKSRFHPEHFRYPNIGFQYINLYVSTISRLLVMSVVTSGTPNYLRYIKTHKLII